MEQLLPVLIIVAVLLVRLRKGIKEQQESEIPPVPHFPPVPMGGEETKRPVPPAAAPQRPQADAAPAGKSPAASGEKPRNFSEKAAALFQKSPAPPARPKPASARPQPHAARPAAQPAPPATAATAEEGEAVSLSTPEEARRAFIHSEIFRRKY